MRWKSRRGRGGNGRARLPAVLIAGALLAVGGCSRAEPRTSAASAYQQARIEFRNAHLDRAVQIARSAAGDSDGLWSARLQLLEAQSLLAQGSIAEAAALLRSPALNNVRADGVVARRRMLEGAVLSRRGDFPAADAAFAEAFKAAARAQDTDTQLETLLSRALMYARRGDLATGDAYLAQALELASRHHDPYHQAAALLNMALFSAKRYRFDEAAMRLQRVVALSAHRDDTGIIRSAALGNLSMCYARLGDFEKAIAIRKEELAFQERSGLRMYLSQSLGEMGNLYLLSGKSAEAANWFRRAAESALANQLPHEAADWYSGLAQALTTSGRLEEAERANEEALRLARSKEDASIILTRGRILAKRGQHDQALRALNALLLRDDAAHIRWEVLAEMAAIQSLNKQYAEATRNYEAALRLIDESTAELARTEHRITLKSRLIGVHQQYIQALIEQGQVERALEVMNATHARVLAAGMKTAGSPVASASQFRQIAKSSSATLLVYRVSAYGSGVWAIGSSGGVRYTPLPDEQQIRTLIREHVTDIEQRMASPVQDTGSAAVKLYDLLVRPVAPANAARARVIIVPDGPLHEINFETLVVREPTPRYWLEDVTLSVAPSLGLLQPEGSARLTAQSRALLIGDPPQVDEAYPRLRAASSELQNVARRFPNHRRQQQREATPSAFRSGQPGGFSLIHFAAHAEANRSSPLDSAIILFGERDRYKLYSRDVLETPLDASLVVLSACRGAGARAYGGEGLVGFSWAFLHAGARNVIAGLWDVSDRSTATLMNRMYDAIVDQKMEPAAALRSAKVSVLRSGGPDSRPWHWAPFQVYTRVWHSASR